MVKQKNNSPQQAIRINNISYHDVIKNLKTRIYKGDRIALTGANGAGKSTLLLLIAGVLIPQQGVIEREKTLSISLVADQPLLYPQLTVIEHLQSRAASQTPALIEHVINLCQLHEVLHMPASRLSKGYRQRLSLALARIEAPDVLLLDEPGDGLDQSSHNVLAQVLKDLAEQSCVILCTHQPELIQAYCSRMLVLAEGAITQDITLLDLQPQWNITFNEPVNESSLQQFDSELKITVIDKQHYTIETAGSFNSSLFIQHCQSLNLALAEISKLPIDTQLRQRMGGRSYQPNGQGQAS